MRKLKRIHASKELSFYSIEGKVLDIPFYESNVPAGFPSPAEDHLDLDLDLSSYLIQHPSATFCVRVEGDSMVGAGIQSGDVILIDRALTPNRGSIVLAILDGEFTVKKVDVIDDSLYLIPETPALQPMKVGEESTFQIWGVVTFVIHKV